MATLEQALAAAPSRQAGRHLRRLVDKRLRKEVKHKRGRERARALRQRQTAKELSGFYDRWYSDTTPIVAALATKRAGTSVLTRQLKDDTTPAKGRNLRRW